MPVCRVCDTPANKTSLRTFLSMRPVQKRFGIRYNNNSALYFGCTKATLILYKKRIWGWLRASRFLYCHFYLRATPHNSARSLRQDFCSNSKFRKWRNTVCISHFRNCGSGAKRRLRLADAIARCCLGFYHLFTYFSCDPWFSCMLVLNYFDWKLGIYLLI